MSAWVHHRNFSAWPLGWKLGMKHRLSALISSWSLAAGLGLLIICGSILAQVARGSYAWLQGKPLPALTQLFLAVHSNDPFVVLAAALFFASLYAFLAYRLITSARDEPAALWRFITLVSLTVPALLLYVAICALATYLPSISFLSGMQQMTPEMVAREEQELRVHLALLAGALLFTISAAAVMIRDVWRKHGR